MFPSLVYWVVYYCSSILFSHVEESNLTEFWGFKCQDKTKILVLKWSNYNQRWAAHDILHFVIIKQKPSQSAGAGSEKRRFDCLWNHLSSDNLKQSPSMQRYQEFWPNIFCNIASVRWGLRTALLKSHRSISLRLRSGLWLSAQWTTCCRFCCFAWDHRPVARPNLVQAFSFHGAHWTLWRRRCDSSACFSEHCTVWPWMNLLRCPHTAKLVQTVWKWSYCPTPTTASIRALLMSFLLCTALKHTCSRGSGCQNFSF